MRCTKAQKLINDHIDNLLDTGQARYLENHLERCGNCRALLADVSAIVGHAKELDTPEPSEDLWPAVKREVLGKNRKARMPGRGLGRLSRLHSSGPVLALSTLLAMVVLIPLLYYSRHDMRNAGHDPEKTVMSDFKMAGEQYRSAIEALDKTIGARDAGLDPELMGVFKINLAIIDESIRVCMKSIDENPNALETNELLMICYRKKIELLNEFYDITMQS